MGGSRHIVSQIDFESTIIHADPQRRHPLSCDRLSISHQSSHTADQTLNMLARIKRDDTGGLCVLLPLSQAFFDRLEQRAKKVFDQAAFPRLDFHRCGHTRRQIHLLAIDFDR
jgi:hypothetical protein